MTKPVYSEEEGQNGGRSTIWPGVGQGGQTTSGACDPLRGLGHCRSGGVTVTSDQERTCPAGVQNRGLRVCKDNGLLLLCSKEFYGWMVNSIYVVGLCGRTLPFLFELTFG